MSLLIDSKSCQPCQNSARLFATAGTARPYLMRCAPATATAQPIERFKRFRGLPKRARSGLRLLVKKRGWILIVLLIDLETKQRSLTFSKMRSIRVRSSTEAITTLGLDDDLNSLVATARDFLQLAFSRSKKHSRWQSWKIPRSLAASAHSNC